MGELSISHLLMVLGITLIFFGPSRLPGLGKSLGEAIRGFKKGLDATPDEPPTRTSSERTTLELPDSRAGDPIHSRQSEKTEQI